MAKLKARSGSKKKTSADDIRVLADSVLILRERIEKYDALMSAAMTVLMKPVKAEKASGGAVEFVGPLAGKMKGGLVIHQCRTLKKPPHKKKLQKKESA